MAISWTLNGLDQECNVFFMVIIIIRPKAPDGSQGGWKFPFSFTSQKWGILCYKSSRGRHNIHIESTHLNDSTHVLMCWEWGLTTFLCKCKNVLCVFPSLRQAGDPQNRFYQDWRRHRWMPASRWVIHVALFWKRIMTRAVIKHK